MKDPAWTALFHTGEAIINQGLDHVNENIDKWPNFSTLEPSTLGFHSVYCLPMRLRGRVIGALNFFRVDPQDLSRR